MSKLIVFMMIMSVSFCFFDFYVRNPIDTIATKQPHNALIELNTKYVIGSNENPENMAFIGGSVVVKTSWCSDVGISYYKAISSVIDDSIYTVDFNLHLPMPMVPIEIFVGSSFGVRSVKDTVDESAVSCFIEPVLGSSIHFSDYFSLNLKYSIIVSETCDKPQRQATNESYGVSFAVGIL